MNQRWRGFAWISILTFLILWAGLIRSLSSFWSTNPQYAYGWTVPALSLFLLWECWNTRPAAVPPQRRGIAIVGAAVLAASILPVYLLLEATPDWRFAHWAFAIQVVGISLCAVHIVGGRPWLMHFGFSIAFIFVAVPWPMKIEQWLIHTFSGWVSTLTVGGLNLCGIPAIQDGNVIEISTGKVGVEDACSGVRSFQATIMAALFLGQLWTFALRPRLVLLGSGVVLAFFCNAARALILSLVAEKKGVGAIDQWHDPAGFTILGVCFLGLLAIALWLRPSHGRALAPAESAPPQGLPATFVVILSAWVLFIAVGTEIWYRSAPPPNAAWWRIEWPEKQNGFAEIPITPAVKDMAFDIGRQGHWRESDGTLWTMFHFRWLPGLATTRIAARWHNPDICLIAAGFQRVAEYEPTIIRKGDIEILFRTYRFDVKDQKNFVFFCVWEDRRDPGEELRPPDEWNPGSRIRAVLQRRRHLGQQVLEVAISGVADEKAALALFRERIVSFVQPDSILPAAIAPAPATEASAR